MGVRSELIKSNQIQGGQLDQDQSFACLCTLRISPAKSLDGEHVIVQGKSRAYLLKWQGYL